jgi:hypothetical protein
MRPKISMWSDYGSPTPKRWRSRRRRNTQSPTGLRILLVAGASVAGVIGISGVYPQIIDSEVGAGNERPFARHRSFRDSACQRWVDPEASTPKPGWVAQLIGDSSETAALSRFHQMQGKLRSVLGGYEPAILRTTIKPGAAPIWVRVRIEFDTRQGADSLCSKLEAAGEPCLVQRNSER